MASLETRRAKSGRVISHRVIWIQRELTPPRQTETFAPDADGERSAKMFRAEVEHAGNRWPEGWVRGVGFARDVVPEAELVAAPAGRARPTVLEHCLAYAASTHTKAQTEHRQKMRRTFRQSLGTLGAMRVDEVTAADVQAWIDELAERYAFKTIKERRGMLSSAFKAATAPCNRATCPVEHVLIANPVKGTTIDVGDHGRAPIFLAQWEVDAIFAGIPAEHLAYVETLVRTGMRPGEAFALRVGDLYLDAEVPSISIVKARKPGHDGKHRIGEPKTRAGRRTVAIDPELVEILRKHTAGRDLGELVFAEHGNDGTWQRNYWVPAVKAARLDRVPRVYDLRHTHASMLLAGGSSLFAVSKRLGHKDITTTSNIYGHLDLAGDAANAAIIGNALKTRPRLRVV